VVGFELGPDILADRCQDAVKFPLVHQRLDDGEVGADIVDGVALNGVLALTEFQHSFAVLDLKEYLSRLVGPEPSPSCLLASLKFVQ